MGVQSQNLLLLVFWDFLVFLVLAFFFCKEYPKNHLRLFFRNNLARLKITVEVKNNLKRLFLTLF